MVKIIKNGIEVESIIDPTSEAEMDVMDETLRKYKDDFILSTSIEVKFAEGTLLGDSMPDEEEKVITINLK
jgi:hypothetical protein